MSGWALSVFNDLTGNTDCNSWRIGRAKIDIAKMRLVEPSSKPIIAAEHLIELDAAFVADPFRITLKDTTYVFAEVWSQSVHRGQIAVFQLNIRDQIVDSDIVLAESFHLSYPCVFNCGGNYYMLPEAWESQQLILYKARRFPWNWERFKILLEIDYADPQIFFHKNIWYIFLNTDPLTNASASIFWTDSLLGNWRPHPQNPIFSSNLLMSRSAGPLVRYGGRIFRFSQDCRQRYGQSVFASEIVELSPSSIRTVPLRQVTLNRPQWALNAFHHLDIFLENGIYYALFDGYTDVRDPQAQ